MTHAGTLLPLLLCVATAQGASAIRPQAAIVCDACDEWNAPREPFRLHGPTWFVGTAGLSSVLITSSDGHVLIDGALPQSAPLIEANIRRLGVRAEDVRLILTSHAHFDHVGGVAALQQLTGATVVSSAAGVAALQRGQPTEDDPQFALGPAYAYPPVTKTRVVTDGEVLRVGSIAVTAHTTPGHTPGGMSWSWQSCDDSRCVRVVYADSLTPVSADDFLFSDGRGGGPLIETFRSSIAKMASLSCDIVVGAHPGFSGLDDKLARRAAGVSPDPFLDVDGCRTYAAAATERLDARIERERSATLP